MFRRRVVSGCAIGLVLLTGAGCSTDHPKSQVTPVKVTKAPHRGTTTTTAPASPTTAPTDTTATTTTATPATTTTVVLPMASKVDPATRDKVQLAWASLKAAFAGLNAAAAIPDPERVDQSLYLHGPSAASFSKTVSDLKAQGLYLENPPGASRERYRGFVIEDQGLIIETCEVDGSIQKRRADNSVVNDHVGVHFVQEYFVLVDGIWKLDSHVFVDERAGECAGS